MYLVQCDKDGVIYSNQDVRSAEALQICGEKEEWKRVSRGCSQGDWNADTRQS